MESMKKRPQGNINLRASGKNQRFGVSIVSSRMLRLLAVGRTASASDAVRLVITSEIVRIPPDSWDTPGRPVTPGTVTRGGSTPQSRDRGGPTPGGS